MNVTWTHIDLIQNILGQTVVRIPLIIQRCCSYLELLACHQKLQHRRYNTNAATVTLQHQQYNTDTTTPTNDYAPTPMYAPTPTISPTDDSRIQRLYTTSRVCDLVTILI